MGGGPWSAQTHECLLHSSSSLSPGLAPSSRLDWCLFERVSRSGDSHLRKPARPGWPAMMDGRRSATGWSTVSLAPSHGATMHEASTPPTRQLSEASPAPLPLSLPLGLGGLAGWPGQAAMEPGPTLEQPHHLVVLVVEHSGQEQ